MPRTSGEQNRPFTASFSAVSILTSIVMFPKPCLLCFLLLYSYNEVADYMSGAPANGFHIGALHHLFFRPLFSHGLAMYIDIILNRAEILQYWCKNFAIA